MNFWEWLTNSGLIKGDPAYYSSGKASPAEVTNALQVAINGLNSASDPTARTEFWNRLVSSGAIKGDPAYYSSGKAGAAEITNAINVASGFFQPGGSVAPAPAPSPGAAPAPASGGMNFWEWLAQPGGLIQGDPTYYSSGKASPGEVSHALEVALNNLKSASDPTAQTEFWKRLVDSGAIQGDPTYYSSGKAGSAEITNAIKVASEYLKSGTAPGTAAPAPDNASGTIGTPGGVLAGGQTIKVDTASGTRFYQLYEFPAGSGQFVSYQFNDKAQAEAALGANFPFSARSETWFDNQVLAQAQAEEISGLKGSWQSLTSEIMKDAAARAGVRDPTLAGRLASDPEMQRIMAQAVIGKWSPEQILAEQRKTNFWKTTLYPGIENLYTRTSDPEAAYSDYMNQVSPLLSALGYQKGADGTYKDSVAKMLGKQIDSNVFASQVPTFIRATQNAEFASTLNAWAQRDLGRSIGFGDWFDLMAGESQPELDQVAERATLEWVAQNQGTRLNQGEIESIAARTQLDPNEAQRAFSEFNQGILGMGDEALGRYGLSRDEVLSAAIGATPTSGRTVDEIKLLVAKTAREQGLADDDKINFYVGFNPMGQPTRPGLQSLAPESA